MRIYLITLIALILGVADACGQNFMDELRRSQNGQGKITVNQSAEIDRLVNTVAQPVTEKATTPKQQTTAAARQETPASTRHETARRDEANSTAAPAHQHSGSDAASAAAATAEAEAPAVNMNKKIMRHSYKATGYRIQVYSGGNKRTDREKCEQISARLKSRFPDLPIYVHFYSPSWKCRAGNYTDIDEARAMLQKIKAMGYTQACLVKGKVNVQY